MSLKHLLSGALVLAIAVPLAAAVYGLENCCYGTTCPSVSGCSLTPTFSEFQCKRTCASGCNDGNGCCQFRIRTCTYSPIPPNQSCRAPFESIVDVHWDANTHCYRDTEGEVDCQQGNPNKTCLQ